MPPALYMADDGKKKKKKYDYKGKYFRVAVRLYRTHDLDLIALYRTKGFRFQYEMRRAASAIAKGSPITIQVPKECPADGYVPYSYHLVLYFSKKEDAELEAMLGEVKAGQRCGLLKAMMRRSLSGIPAGAYLRGDGLSMSRVGDVPNPPVPAADPGRNAHAREKLLCLSDAARPETPVVREDSSAAQNASVARPSAPVRPAGASDGGLKAAEEKPRKTAPEAAETSALSADSETGPASLQEHPSGPVDSAADMQSPTVPEPPSKSKPVNTAPFPQEEADVPAWEAMEQQPDSDVSSEEDEDALMAEMMEMAALNG